MTTKPEQRAKESEGWASYAADRKRGDFARFPETALQLLLEDNWKVFREHRPAGAYLPICQLDGEEWPCGDVLDVFAPVTKVIRAAEQMNRNHEETP